jgi:hypothetical protein
MDVGLDDETLDDDCDKREESGNTIERRAKDRASRPCPMRMSLSRSHRVDVIPAPTAVL